MKTISIVIFLILLSITSTFAQQRKSNPDTGSSETVASVETQPEVSEVPVSREQILTDIIARAVIESCKQYRKCNNLLNHASNILVPNQENSEPVQYFNRSTRRSNTQTRYWRRRN